MNGLLFLFMGLGSLAYKYYPVEAFICIVSVVVFSVAWAGVISLQMFSSLRHARTVTSSLQVWSQYSSEFNNKTTNNNSYNCKSNSNTTTTTTTSSNGNDQTSFLARCLNYGLNHQGSVINTTAPVSLSLNHIKAYLKVFIANECDNKICNIDNTGEDFVEWIVTRSMDENLTVNSSSNSSNDSKLIEIESNTTTNNNTTTTATSVKLVKESGQKLNLMSERRAKEYFNAFVDANLFEFTEVDVDSFDIVKYWKEK